MAEKIIHQMWIGPKMPDWMRSLPDTWQAHHPEWEYRLWTEPPSLVNQRLWDEAETISPQAPEQFRADVARYEILYQHGGVWADTDMECLKPIDPLNKGEFMGWETDRWANNAVIGAMQHSQFMAEAIARLPVSVIVNRGTVNTKKSGPQFITPIAERHHVTFYPQSYFYPYSYQEIDQYQPGEQYDFGDAYAVHHWQNRRRRVMPQLDSRWPG